MKQIRPRFVATALLILLISGLATAEDIVEFLSGAKARGTVKEIRKADKKFDFELQVGGRRVVRTYGFEKVHAVTMNGKRYVLTPKSAGTPRNGSSTSRRTRAQVVEHINTVGATPPDWYEATQPDYPKSLDLNWPLKPEGNWNNQRNVGQFKWDIINPNPARWRSGVRLVHEIMLRHEKQPELLERDMKTLGEMYFELFQDYARAAFWLRKAKVQLPDPKAIHLAECYWRLGSETMAKEILSARRLTMNAIKLLGEMGDTDRAGKLADAFGRSNKDRAHEPYLLAGDAFRRAGDAQKSLRYYEKVLDLGKARNENYQKIYMGRARDSIAAIKLFDQADVSKVADGSYRATSTGYNGPLEIEVKVRSGKIESLRVTRHQEKQFYAALTHTPNQIIKKQAVTEIDATSRATITSQAIVNATAQALAKGAE